MVTEKRKDLIIKTKLTKHRFKLVQLCGNDKCPSIFSQPKDPRWKNKPHIDFKRFGTYLHVDPKIQISRIPINKIKVCSFPDNKITYCLPNIASGTQSTTAYIGWNQELKEYKDEIQIDDVVFEMSFSDDRGWRYLRKKSGPPTELAIIYLTEKNGVQKLNKEKIALIEVKK